MFLLTFQCSCCTPSLLSSPSIPNASEYDPNIPSAAECPIYLDIRISSKSTCKVRIIYTYIYIVSPHLLTSLLTILSRFLSIFPLIFLSRFLSTFLLTFQSIFLSTFLLIFLSTLLSMFPSLFLSTFS